MTMTFEFAMPDRSRSVAETLAAHHAAGAPHDGRVEWAGIGRAIRERVDRQLIELAAAHGGDPGRALEEGSRRALAIEQALGLRPQPERGGGVERRAPTAIQP